LPHLPAPHKFMWQLSYSLPLPFPDHARLRSTVDEALYRSVIDLVMPPSGHVQPPRGV